MDKQYADTGFVLLVSVYLGVFVTIIIVFCIIERCVEQPDIALRCGLHDGEPFHCP